MVLLSGKKDSDKAGLAAREVPPECIGPGTLLHELTDAGIASIGQKPRGPSGPVAATTVELSRLETGLNCRGLYVSRVKDGGCGRMACSAQSFSSCMSPAPSRSCSSCTGPAPKPFICFSSFSSLEASSDTNSPAVARLILVIGLPSLFFMMPRASTSISRTSPLEDNTFFFGNDVTGEREPSTNDIACGNQKTETGMRE